MYTSTESTKIKQNQGVDFDGVGFFLELMMWIRFWKMLGKIPSDNSIEERAIDLDLER